MHKNNHYPESDQDEALTDYQNIIREQKRKIIRLHQELDTLNITLSEIYASEGWKILSVYYKLRNGVLPRGSARHRLIQRIINFLRGKKEDAARVSAFGKPGFERYKRTAPPVFEPFSFPRFAHPKVSIIVPAYTGWEMNYLCLRAIWEFTEGVSYEVIFADDGATDETVNIEQYIQNIVRLRDGVNRGFLRNCNYAATHARGEYVHFLNNDTEVTEGWLTSLVALMEKDPSIGMAGSKLVYPNGRLQEAGGIVWKDGSAWNYGHSQDPDAPEYNYVKEVDYISGASILVRKSLWDQLGGFNEMYLPAYCEDSDLAFEVREAGYRVVYQPQSMVVHFEGFSHGKDTDVAPEAGVTPVKAYQKTNSVKFAEKWKPVLDHQYPNGENAFWTRDRSRNKPTVVVIDHYIPQFDKDAGSRTTFQYLELFTELGMNVKFIGDNFYHQEPYASALQQMGIEVLYGDYYKANWKNWLRDNDRYIDFIFLNRPHIAVKYIRFINENLAAKVFYYTHDLHFYRELMEYEVTKDPKTLESSREWKKMEYQIFEDSEVVLTASGKERDILRKDFPAKPIKVMPAFFYPDIADPARDFDRRRDLLFVGGFGHAPNVDALLWFVSEVMPQVGKANPDIRLLVVGSRMPDSILRLESPQIVIKGFVPDEELDELYQSVRLAVIPLRFGAGLKGKTVEALVKGVPIVSTSFGLEGLDGIEPVARPVDSAEAFAAAVTTLYDDTNRLSALSREAVDYARAHFTKASAASFFKELFLLK